MFFLAAHNHSNFDELCDIRGGASEIVLVDESERVAGATGARVGSQTAQCIELGLGKRNGDISADNSFRFTDTALKFRAEIPRRTAIMADLFMQSLLCYGGGLGDGATRRICLGAFLSFGIPSS